jgi:hypothetical protein
MSGGHYDCFYEWSDFDQVAARMDLVEQVLADYEAMGGMDEAAKVIRDHLVIMQAARLAWGESFVPDLCQAMDWHQAMDHSEKTLREHVREIFCVNLHGHDWGPTLYALEKTGKTFCFSPPEVTHRFVRFCKRCFIVESMNVDTFSSWKREHSLLTEDECKEILAQREREIASGKEKERVMR